MKRRRAVAADEIAVRPISQGEIQRTAAWVAESILIAGGMASTAYTCAAAWARGLENAEHRRQQRAAQTNAPAPAR